MLRYIGMNWEKVKEFLAVLLASVVVFFLMGNGGNIERAIFAGSTIFVLYYMKEDLFSNFHKEGDKTVASKLGGVFAILLAVWLGGGILTYLVWEVSGADYCKGWAKSEQYCAIQQVKERYNSDYEYEGF